MKVVILAGGLGTRIREETYDKPKPMIEVGNQPILWHIMKHYAHHGFREFIICLGYKGQVIKDYFLRYAMLNADFTIDLQSPSAPRIHNRSSEEWKITLVDTGPTTLTGGRIKRIGPYVGEEPFMLTYGDGLADIDLRELVSFHQSHGKLATVTATQPQGRFGGLHLSADSQVMRFEEKRKGDGGWINGGFFILQPEVLSFIQDDSTTFEKEPLEQLAASGELMAYRHNGFWHPMDSLKDKQALEQYWLTGHAPWKTWS
ncbi:glucose-1-phosphate cytidylyltransferase [Paenibacillus daejeonensis]|uniref:glucose-1-phosphate cytidylyltransferase n=1 Tax=Paenibacillus daejeonensis TaxID=135193 RepID=UPI00036C894C|nr:glucose-1-phosphate cytidylyltransferase [Paenibacillus daejeonensis]